MTSPKMNRGCIYSENLCCIPNQQEVPDLNSLNNFPKFLKFLKGQAKIFRYLNKGDQNCPLRMNNTLMLND